MSFAKFAFVALSTTLSMTACGSDAGKPSSAGALAGKTYVLVHGAWMGAWAWDDVAPALRAQGATVTVVELPGHGADMTPTSDDTLQAYVNEVTAAVDASSTPVILVGHSMGGVVVTQVAENRPDRVEKLVYLAAYVPADGQSLFALGQTDADSHVGKDAVVDQTAGLMDIPMADLQDVFLADGTPEEVAKLTMHYRPEPLAPLVTPVHTTAANWGRVPKAYFYTQQDHAVSFTLQQRMTSGTAFVSTATFDTGHAPFMSEPALVVAALADL
jgi:pimeloyl-ACP methyl ester carboxylesterase